MKHLRPFFKIIFFKMGEGKTDKIGLNFFILYFYSVNNNIFKINIMCSAIPMLTLYCKKLDSDKRGKISENCSCFLVGLFPHSEFFEDRISFYPKPYTFSHWLCVFVCMCWMINAIMDFCYKYTLMTMRRDLAMELRPFPNPVIFNLFDLIAHIN